MSKRRKPDTSRPHVLSGSVKIPAGQDTPAPLRIRFPEGTPAEVTLKLSRGSFSGDRDERQRTFELTDGVADVEIYATRFPNSAWLTGHGLRLRLGYVPASFKHKLLWEWLPVLIGSLVMTVAIRTFAFASFFIPSSSMENTVMVGDLVLSWNVGFQIMGEDPQRGDIIVFDHPNPTHEMWIKRVIGLPGDVVESYGGQVVVNGRVLFEPYVRDKSFFDFGPVIVPFDAYFVMGDNRNDSDDSRFWGCLPRRNIVGRAAYIYWPLDNARYMYDE